MIVVSIVLGVVILLALLKKFASENVYRMVLILSQLLSPSLVFIQDKTGINTVNIELFYLIVYVSFMFLFGLYNLYNLVGEIKNQINYQLIAMAITPFAFVNILVLKLLVVLYVSLFLWFKIDQDKVQVHIKLISVLFSLSLLTIPAFPYITELNYLILFLLLFFQIQKNDGAIEVFVLVVVLSMIPKENKNIVIDIILMMFFWFLSLKFFLEKNIVSTLEKTLKKYALIEKWLISNKIRNAFMQTYQPYPAPKVTYKSVGKPHFNQHLNDTKLGALIILALFLLGILVL